MSHNVSVIPFVKKFLKYTFALRVLLMVILCKDSTMLHAQPNTDSFTYSLQELISSERFIVNAKVYKNRKLISNKELTKEIRWDEHNMRVTFRTDSINWIIRDSLHNTYNISFPNDLTLITGVDRKELQDRLVKKLFASQSSSFIIEPSNKVNGEIRIQKSDPRYGILTRQRIEDSHDGSLVCDYHHPSFSLINAFADTIACRGLYPLKLVIHRYGYQTDTLDTDVPTLLKITDSVTWSKWSISENEELTLLLQHPFLSFDHLLYLRQFKSKGKLFWLTDLYTFIPTHNLSSVFSRYNPESRKELIWLNE